MGFQHGAKCFKRRQVTRGNFYHQITHLPVLIECPINQRQLPGIGQLWQNTLLFILKVRLQIITKNNRNIGQ